MNLVLLHQEDFIDSHRVRFSGRRYEHISKIHKARPGDELCVGVKGGKIGSGRILKMDTDSVEMDVTLTENPPPPLPLTLILALPRPQVIKRTLLCAASLGIKKIIFLNFFRVEKSLWQSSSLKKEAIEEQIILGLEQAKDTILPEVKLRKLFKPFVEDELPGLIKGTLAFVAHPGSPNPCPKDLRQPVTLAIGPEGGMVDYELESLRQMDFKDLDLGPRILRVESVLPFMIGRLF